MVVGGRSQRDHLAVCVSANLCRLRVGLGAGVAREGPSGCGGPGSPRKRLYSGMLTFSAALPMPTLPSCYTDLRDAHRCEHGLHVCEYSFTCIDIVSDGISPYFFP